MRSIHQLIAVVLCYDLVVGEVCSPDDNVYYESMLDSCEKCDTCLSGMEKDYTNGKDRLQWDQVRGALTCISCKPCRSGYYSDKRGYTCKPCRDCAQQGLYQRKECSKYSNAECGDEIQKVTTNTSQIDLLKTTGPSSILVFVLTSIGAFILTLVLLIIIHSIRRHFQRSDNITTINNNLKPQDNEQNAPLVVVEKTNNPCISTMYERNLDTTTSHQQHLLTLENNVLKCKAETTPKEVVSDDTHHSEMTQTSCRCKATNGSNGGQSTSYVSHARSAHQDRHSHLKMCCAAIMDTSSDDVSKTTSLDSCCLALESLSKEVNIKSQDTSLSSCNNTCVLNRSECKTSSYQSNSSNECSPSYFCKCFECSACAC